MLNKIYPACPEQNREEQSRGKKFLTIILFTVFGLGVFGFSAEAQAAEFLGRGLFCLPKDGLVYCSWRLLPIDASNAGFHVYRSGAVDGPFAKLTSSPITGTTDFLDSSAQSGMKYYYLVKTVNADGAEGPSSNLSKVTAGATKNYIDIPLFSSSETITATAIADLNGDGVMDFAFHSPNASGDDCDRNNKPTTTSTKLGALISENGFWTPKWKVDTKYYNCVGPTYPELNLYAGPLLAWDLDGDQKAEVITRWGRIGETLAIVDGETGNIKASIAWPQAIVYSGDERSAANVVRLEDMNGDGIADPFIVVQNGLYSSKQSFTTFYYNPQTGQIEKVREKVFSESARGRGTHGLVSSDIDNDSKDEIIACGVILDDDLSLIKQINNNHNDVCYVGDIRPDIDGLEMWMGPEFNPVASAVNARGDILWSARSDATYTDADGWEHGWCAELTTKYSGLECFAFENKDTSPGAMYNARLFSSRGVDITAEFISPPFNGRPAQSKAPVDWEHGDGVKELYSYGAPPGVYGAGWYFTARGDILGDSREEVVGYAFSKDWYNVPGVLRININNKANSIRHITPLSDRNYRAGLSRSGVGYTYNNIPSVSGQQRDDVVYPDFDPLACTSWTYSSWTPTICPVSGIQTRTVVTSSPSGCSGGSPVLAQSCAAPGLCSIDPSGTYIDAENFTNTIPASPGTGTFSRETSKTGYLGSGYLKANGEGTGSEGKEYEVNFTTPGNYKVWIKGAGFNGNTDTVWIGLDNIKTGAILSSQNGNWAWRNNLLSGSGTNIISVPTPGVHKFNIWIREYDQLVDGIYLTQGIETPTDLSHGTVIDPTSCKNNPIDTTPPAVPTGVSVQ